MPKPLFGLLLLLTGCATTAPAVPAAPLKDEPNTITVSPQVPCPPPPDSTYSFGLRDAPLVMATQPMADLTCRSYRMAQELGGVRVTVASEKAVTVAELETLFLAALSQVGLSLRAEPTLTRIERNP